MKSYKLLLALLLFISFNAFAQQGKNCIQYVNPFIGNADNGHTFPGACAPFGLIQVSPESGNGSWRYCSGFNYDDDKIVGFSQTHLNGTGIPDLGDIRVFPFNKGFQGGEYASSYNRESQIAKPGYYSVNLTEMDIDVELTATERTSFHKYIFNRNEGALLLLDLQSGLVFDNNSIRYRVRKSNIEFPDDRTIIGYNRVKGWVNRDFFYVIKFDKPFRVKEKLPSKENQKANRFILEFDTDKDNEILIKTGMSTVSIDGAKTALEAENPDWNFDEIRQKTEDKWNKLLSAVEIEGNQEQKTNFYTSLYHLYMQPNNIADIDGRYRGANDSVFISSSGAYYSTFSLWDTYRAAHPLYTILLPDKVDDFVQSMLAHYKVQGYLPIWTLWGKENHCMIGNHSIPVIVDAYLKGFAGFDAEEAYRAVKESSTVSHKNSDWETYNKYGYYPFDIVSVESVSRTLESAYDDYCVAQMAEQLGKTDDYQYFMKRSLFYKNLFDTQPKLMRGKDSKGKWRTPFSSFSLSHASSIGGDYTEGNAWQYTWHVQHDVAGLIELMGGKQAFATKLDSLFFIEKPVDKKAVDVTGLVGQYAHGNEPSHHVVYLYTFADKPYKTQELIREIFDRFYLPKPDGLCGNDDCGQMSAWYMFSAMGFYPVNPCGGEYIIGAPQIPAITLNLKNGKNFRMKALNLSSENRYVKSVSFNGKEITDFRIQHENIMNGGELLFTMTNQPNK
jgi:predicted alpha-1,2-mannosidase